MIASVGVWLGAAAAWLIPAGLLGAFAHKKGRNPLLYGALSLLISPLITLLILLFSKNPARERDADPFARLKYLEGMRDAGRISPDEFEAELAKLDSPHFANPS